MASSMLEEEGTRINKGPRVVVRISSHMQFLLSLVARHSLRTKKSIHDDIWAAGLKAYLGLGEEDLDEAQISSLPRGVQPPRDVKRLVKKLIGED